tara:strand:- start:201 stop:317 length:117 start_codon:yes stop_codon:yes gene_type:complete
MVEWTLIQALLFGLIATILSVGFMILITYLDNKSKEED